MITKEICLTFSNETAKYMFKKRYPTLENVIEYKKKIEKDYHNEVRAMMPQQQINPQIIEIFDISDSDDES